VSTVTLALEAMERLLGLVTDGELKIALDTVQNQIRVYLSALFL
jgi:hypothetical protein